MRRRWISLCRYMNYRFPQNVIFPREKQPMTAYAIIKRTPPPSLTPPQMCDRCGARALWLVKVSADLRLALCGHHHEAHAPHIAASGYAEEQLPAPVTRS